MMESVCTGFVFGKRPDGTRTVSGVDCRHAPLAHEKGRCSMSSALPGSKSFGTETQPSPGAFSVSLVRRWEKSKSLFHMRNRKSVAKVTQTGRRSLRWPMSRLGGCGSWLAGCQGKVFGLKLVGGDGFEPPTLSV